MTSAESINYLANLLHAREVPVLKGATGDSVMSAEEIEAAEYRIKEMIPDFNYAATLEMIKNKSEMKRYFQSTSVGYDKLQLFRIYKQIHLTFHVEEDSILQKFANESFHIENEYVMQLNPHKFDNIPEYIVQECERAILAS